jgi:hypothetical protein
MCHHDNEVLPRARDTAGNLTTHYVPLAAEPSVLVVFYT